MPCGCLLVPVQLHFRHAPRSPQRPEHGSRHILSSSSGIVPRRLLVILFRYVVILLAWMPTRSPPDPFMTGANSVTPLKCSTAISKTNPPPEAINIAISTGVQPTLRTSQTCSLLYARAMKTGRTRKYPPMMT